MNIAGDGDVGGRGLRLDMAGVELRPKEQGKGDDDQKCDSIAKESFPCPRGAHGGPLPGLEQHDTCCVL